MASMMGLLAMVSGIVSGIGLMGVAIIFNRPDPIDENLGVVYYRMYCSGTAGSVFVFQIAAWRILTRFINLLDDAVANAVQRVAETLNSGGSKKLDHMRDIAQRFRSGRNMLVTTAPVGVGVWVVQAAILPMFWYIILLHFVNATVGCFAVWFSLVSIDQKRKIVEKATGGLMVGSVLAGLSFSGGSGKSKICREEAIVTKPETDGTSPDRTPGGTRVTNQQRTASINEV